MGCIYKSAALNVPADAAWRVLDRYTRSEVHIFSISTGERQEGDYRVVTMADGADVWELNVSVDPQLRRAAYTIPDLLGAEHHHAVMQIVEDASGAATLLWVTDIRPDELVASMVSVYDRLFEELKLAVEAG